MVYAYGSSAGGTLAALLAGDGLVTAAVAKAPVSDLVGWEWPLGAYGADYYERVGSASRPATGSRRCAARPGEPLLRDPGPRRPGRAAPMSEAFADKFERVHLWVGAGRPPRPSARSP